MSLKPKEQVEARPAENAAMRIHYCRGMLYLWGFLTEQEQARVKRRIEKWVSASHERRNP